MAPCKGIIEQPIENFASKSCEQYAYPIFVSLLCLAISSFTLKLIIYWTGEEDERGARRTKETQMADEDRTLTKNLDIVEAKTEVSHRRRLRL